MLDNDNPGDVSTETASQLPAGEPAPATDQTAPSADGEQSEGTAPAAKKAARKAPAKKVAAKKAAAKKTTAKKTAAKKTAAAPAEAPVTAEAPPATEGAPAERAPAPGTAGTAEAAEAPETAEAAEAPESAEATEAPAAKKAARKAPAKKVAAKKAAAKKTTTKKAAAKKSAAAPADVAAEAPSLLDAEGNLVDAEGRRIDAEGNLVDAEGRRIDAEGNLLDADGNRLDAAEGAPAPAAISATALLFQPPQPVKAPARRTRKTAAQRAAEAAEAEAQVAEAAPAPAAETAAGETPTGESEQEPKPTRRRTRKTAAQKAAEAAEQEEATGTAEPEAEQPAEAEQQDEGENGDEQGGNRRRRRRGGRRRRKSGGNGEQDNEAKDEDDESEDQGADRETQAESEGGSGSTRRRRRRRRAGEEGDGGPDDPENTVTRVRKARTAEDEITALHGSTRLEAKKQRRREGREAGRRRAPIVSEAEFLARREAVDRVMVIRQRKDLTQIAVLEDKVLVEHYVARESQTSLIGNVYLGRVQNVLPSMEAAFIDIGKGRNAVLYAGEVNWDALGAGNGPRKIEAVLKSGQSVLVQVTKDPIGHKGARLTSQISLPGRFLVYVPDGTTSGISRKLPDTERSRLKSLLKEIVPDSAGVIVRTAAEGASEEELTHDVERLTARWEDISAKVAKGNAPQLLYGEPDLTLKVVRDLFTEDFGKLVVSGEDAWDMVESYVEHVAPDLADRLERHDASEDVFATYRIDEQIDKALDRKVWLPSGGSLIIDRTEAMTVVDVNTGKFTGSGGNLEETVTKNNLEAAEEIVRQLRLRDIGGIIVVDFIDMVLESNRDLVLRRMVECLGRDRTRHQVAEVTSLGLVQMTRKRIGTGLLEAFSEPCEHCGGRGLVTHHEPVEPKKKQEEEPRRSRRGRNRGKGEDDHEHAGNGNGGAPSPKDVAAMARHEHKVEEVAPDGAEPAEAAGATEPAEAPREVAAPALAPVAAEPAPSAPETVSGAVAETGTHEPAPVDEPQPDAGQPAEQPAAEPAPVTRTSRRQRGRATRAAGPAAAAAEAAAVMSVPSTPEPAAAAVETAPPAPETTGDEQPLPVAASAVAAETAAPRVVTSTRRRVSRPAGPPSGHAADGAGAPESAEDPDATAAAHVPVKKKGSRKR